MVVLLTIIIMLSIYSYIAQILVTLIRITFLHDDEDYNINSVREFLWYLVPVIPSLVWSTKICKKMYKNLRSLPL